MAADDDWRVELDAYAGPLDLLLYLVQREEVDVHDIPVARILDRYLEFLRETPIADLDRAGDFLVMASTLMAIKSAMLLPNTDPEVEALADPRDELVRQLIEYRALKEAGEDLRRRRDEAFLRWGRGRAPQPEVPEEDREGPPGVREATLFDVFAAFHRLLRETSLGEPRRIVYDEVPQERHIERILDAATRGGGAARLEDLLGERRDRPFVLGTFLALLELMKEGRLLAVQRGTDPEIRVVLRDSDAGREAVEAMVARARRSEEESDRAVAPAPRRAPPWLKGKAPPDAPPDAAPAADGPPPPAPSPEPPADPVPSPPPRTPPAGPEGPETPSA